MKLSELSRSTKLVLMVITTIVVIALFYYFFDFAVAKIGNWNINRRVNSGAAQSQTYKQEAANNNANAANAEINRQIEDGVREKVIKPKLDAARRQSQNSKAELDAAKRKYENEKNNPQNLNSAHADNCRDLARLFPNTTFDDCR